MMMIMLVTMLIIVVIIMMAVRCVVSGYIRRHELAPTLGVTFGSLIG